MSEKELAKMEALINEAETFSNSLSGLADSLAGAGFGFDQNDFAPQISQVNSMWDNCRWYLVSNLRQLLSQIYVEHGIIQTLVDQPVDDGFRGGITLKTNQLSKDEQEQLLVYCEKNQVIASVMQAIKWGRLFGGGSILLITDQDPLMPLDLKAIGEDSPLEFRSTDMWELYFETQNSTGQLYPGGDIGSPTTEWYNYYGKRVHHSRVIRVVGKEAPSFIRPRLRGWGMSEIERVVRSMNQYLKNQDVIFELLDEAKVDVYRIKGFNTSLLTNAGTEGVQKRIQLGNMLKNYNNALVMDANDEYIQKQMTFSGLSEVLLQIRQGIAADLKMPMTKLFGVSSSGFNSGEDDIENYNSMIEGEIRSKNKFLVVEVLQIACQKLFGMMPDDLMIEFAPLRILNAKEEEEVKNSQFNRTIAAFGAGLATAQEAKQSFNKDSLIPVEVDENSEALPPLGEDFTTSGKFQVEGGVTGKAGRETKEEA